MCIYDFPRHNETQTTTCNLEYACAPLQGALEYGNLNPKNETEYGYCEADSNAFYGTSIDDCVSCLRSSPSTYMANCKLTHIVTRFVSVEKNSWTRKLTRHSSPRPPSWLPARTEPRHASQYLGLPVLYHSHQHHPGLQLRLQFQHDVLLSLH